MIHFALSLVLISMLWGDFTIRGDKLELNQSQWFQRFRWFGLGMLATIILSEHTLQDDWLSWSCVLILAFGAARVPEKSQKPQNASDSNSIIQRRLLCK